MTIRNAFAKRWAFFFGAGLAAAFVLGGGARNARAAYRNFPAATCQLVTSQAPAYGDTQYGGAGVVGAVGNPTNLWCPVITDTGFQPSNGATVEVSGFLVSGTVSAAACVSYAYAVGGTCDFGTSDAKQCGYGGVSCPTPVYLHPSPASAWSAYYNTFFIAVNMVGTGNPSYYNSFWEYHVAY